MKSVPVGQPWTSLHLERRHFSSIMKCCVSKCSSRVTVKVNERDYYCEKHSSGFIQRASRHLRDKRYRFEILIRYNPPPEQVRSFVPTGPMPPRPAHVAPLPDDWQQAHKRLLRLRRIADKIAQHTGYTVTDDMLTSLENILEKELVE